MKTNEIMIGDWVHYNGVYCQVIGTNFLCNTIDIKEEGSNIDPNICPMSVFALLKSDVVIEC